MMNLKYLLVFTAISLLASAAQARTEMYYVHSDHLGTPQVLTDKDQQVVWRRSQTPFGETVEESGTVIQPLRFPGQYEDPETAFHYNYFRDYDPTIGRYIQSDPIGLEGGVNTYGYVTNNPLGLIDLFGLNGQMSRHKGRQINRGPGGRVGIVGCIFNCASYIEGGRSAKSSFSLALGGAILVCSSPKNTVSSDPTAENCELNEGGIYPESEVSGVSASPPGRLGAIIGVQINSDGSFCISIGPMLSLPSPTLDLGDIR